MKDLELELVRIYLAHTYTIGKLYVDGVYFCDNIEKENETQNRNI